MIILASGSPRRRELLKHIVPEFTVLAADTDETVERGLSPEQTVKTLALRKARAVFELRQNDFVIGSDTVVALGDEILGKPLDEADAAAMLRRLSGREHTVYTGVAFCSPEGEEVFCDSTHVRFRKLDDSEIAAYVATGEPMDKAGAYGIQGGASAFVESVEGSLSNVVGFPVELVKIRLNHYHIP